jgi:hypothetical protein
MRDGGKGDTPRPLGVTLEKFDNNWDAIFKNKGVSLNSATHPETFGPPTKQIFNSELNPESLETIEIEVKE